MEGRTLFDLVFSFVFREGMALSPGDGVTPPAQASTVDVGIAVLRTVFFFSVLLLCSRSVERILSFFAGQVRTQSWWFAAFVSGVPHVPPVRRGWPLTRVPCPLRVLSSSSVLACVRVSL